MMLICLYTQCIIGIGIHFIQSLVLFIGLRFIQGIFIQVNTFIQGIFIYSSRRYIHPGDILL